MKINKDWESDEYYDCAKKGSEDLKHPGMILLQKYSIDCRKILDVGCGEGTRLANIAQGKEGYGIDISKKAIQRATDKYKSFRFINGNIEKLPFRDSFFDLVYSAYVFEHVDHPERIIKEIVRVLKSGGIFVIIAPNFGSPNRSSPNYQGKRWKKLFGGYIADLASLFNSKKHLAWNIVKPKANNRYNQDSDTTIEPYLRSLIDFLKVKNINILDTNSCWNEELKDAKLIQRIFKLLAASKIYPFIYWGPHLILAAKKN